MIIETLDKNLKNHIENIKLSENDSKSTSYKNGKININWLFYNKKNKEKEKKIDFTQNVIKINLLNKLNKIKNN